jgi:hypothetical protein
MARRRLDGEVVAGLGIIATVVGVFGAAIVALIAKAALIGVFAWGLYRFVVHFTS